MPAFKWAFFCPFFVTMIGAFYANSAEVRRSGFISDIEYARADGESLRMDAFVPSTADKTAAIVLVHGGGWVAGNRRIDMQPLLKPLSDAGFAWFSIDYRLVQNLTQFGVGIDDVEQAVGYVKMHAAEFNVDPQRIALLGESAGGQLAAIAALRASTATSVKAVVALYTPTDLVALLQKSDYVPARIRDSVRGTPLEDLVLAGLSQLSPIENVRPDMPPFLLIHGTADPLVPFQQSREMCDRMNKAGATCELYPVEGAGHGIRWWESSPAIAAGYKHKIVQWLRQELGGLERAGS